MYTYKGKDMKQEKSCGAIVYHVSIASTIRFLLLRHRHGGQWSFPKGHVEAGETEVQTALREVLEETGLTINLMDEFRHSVNYFPKPGVRKQVVYFLAETVNDKFIRQESEISEIRWMKPKDALRSVTFGNDRELIIKAINYLEGEKCR